MVSTFISVPQKLFNLNHSDHQTDKARDANDTLLSTNGMPMKYILLLISMIAVSPVFAAASGGGDKENAITTGKINYFLLEPNFVVNIKGKRGLRYMQTAIQIMTYDAETVTALQTHAAPIRHDLLMLLSDQKVETMQNASERERIRAEALKIVQRNLEKYAHISPDDTVKDAEEKSHPAGVQELYFTDLVIQ